MPDQQHDSKNLGVKTQLLLLLLPPPLAALERDKAPLSNLLQAQGLPPPPRAFGGITIREPRDDVRLAAQVWSHVASSLRQEVGWQTTFRLGHEPLPAIASVRTWAQGEGGRVAQSLVQGLFLPEDMHFLSSGADESLTTRLQ